MCVLFIKGVVGVFILFLHMCAYVRECAFSWVEECVDNCIAFLSICVWIDRETACWLIVCCMLNFLVVVLLLFFLKNYG